MASRLHQRLAELDQPSEITDEEEIWALIRLTLVLLRIILFVAIIVVSELMESYTVYNLSMALWSIIIGVPLFVLLSMAILFGDKVIKNQHESSVETTVLRPIRERL
jgi:type VI protein secretion system component VasK